MTLEKAISRSEIADFEDFVTEDGSRIVKKCLSIIFLEPVQLFLKLICLLINSRPCSLNLSFD